MIEPPSRSGQPHGVADDLLQHLVEVQGRAHRLADLAQRLELLDLARQLGAARLQGPHQVDLPQHDRALDGELLEQLALPVVEGSDVVRHMVSTPTTSSSRIIGAESRVR